MVGADGPYCARAVGSSAARAQAPRLVQLHVWLDFPRAALSSRMSFSLARTCRRRAWRTRAHLLARAPGMSRRRARAVLSGSSAADPSRPRCLRGGLVGRHAWVERCDGLLIVGDPSHRSAAHTWPARFASHYWGRRHACRHFDGRLQRVPVCKRALACMARAVAIATLRFLSSVFALASFVCTRSARAVLNLPSGSSGCPREAARDVRPHGLSSPTVHPQCSTDRPCDGSPS